MKKAIIEFADGTTKEVKCSDEVYDVAVKMAKSEQDFGFYKPVRKKRKFVAMTNRDYFKRQPLCAKCPQDIGLENYYMACGVLCEIINDCGKCWNLPAKRNGRWILKEVKK